jgi:hypothetical protein
MDENNKLDDITTIDLRGVARAVNRSEATVLDWVAKGIFPAPFQAFPGGPRLWTLKKLKDWIEKRQRARYRPPTPRGALRRGRELKRCTSTTQAD